jgi:hypothetical protein
MKRLLWSVSLACFLPIVAEMPSQAAGNFDVVANPSTNLADSKANDFVDNTANLSDPFASAESFAPAQKIAAADPFGTVSQQVAPLESVTPVDSTATNLDNPFAPIQLAGKPTEKKPGFKKSTSLKTVSTSNQLKPAQSNGNLLSQGDCNCGGGAPAPSLPAGNDRTELDQQLQDLNSQKFQSTVSNSRSFQASPAMSISNPVGFGADGGVGFLSGSYQSTTRGTSKSDGELGIGLGLFDANEAVGLELGYSINSFGTSQGFGSGGFNAKLHKRFGDAALALGWNRFANVTFGNTGNATDYPKNSYYAVATQVVRTTEDVDSFLSRISLSAGVGGGQFLPYSTTSTNLDPSGVNAFGSAAFRLAKPISAIVEWTGQDLAAGLSLAPFGDFPLVITPAFRDISGINGQSARFVLGVGTAFKF